MPILFGTLTALVLAVSAWITYKNDSEYKRQIALTVKQEKIKVGLQRDLAEAVALNLKTTNERIGLEADNKRLKEDLKQLADKIQKVKDEIAMKIKKKTDLEKEVEEGKEILAPLGKIETLVAEIKKTSKDIVRLRDEITDMTAKKNNLIQVKNETAKVIDVQTSEQEMIANGISLARLNTSIKAVYSNWGFVTLNGGDVQGVVSGSMLNVIRDGEVIAKLKVTTVEPNRAAADILRETVAKDVTIRRGDKVVAESLPKEEKSKKAN